VGSAHLLELLPVSGIYRPAKVLVDAAVVFENHTGLHHAPVCNFSPALGLWLSVLPTPVLLLLLQILEHWQGLGVKTLFELAHGETGDRLDFLDPLEGLLWHLLSGLAWTDVTCLVKLLHVFDVVELLRWRPGVEET